MHPVRTISREVLVTPQRPHAGRPRLNDRAKIWSLLHGDMQESRGADPKARDSAHCNVSESRPNSEIPCRVRKELAPLIREDQCNTGSYRGNPPAIERRAISREVQRPVNVL
jgi:hypothetical protein